MKLDKLCVMLAQRLDQTVLGTIAKVNSTCAVFGIGFGWPDLDGAAHAEISAQTAALKGVHTAHATVLKSDFQRPIG